MDFAPISGIICHCLLLWLIAHEFSPDEFEVSEGSRLQTGAKKK